MTYFIGGLYKEEDRARTAVRSLQQAGFPEQEITMLVRKPVKATEIESRASTQDVLRSAVVGASLVGLIGAVLGLLIGIGTIPIQGVVPSFEPGVSSTIVGFTIFTFLISAVTGAIIGAAVELLSSPEKPKITPQGVIRGGLLVVVNVERAQDKTARSVLEDSGAVDVKNLSEKWDPGVWSRYQGYETS